MKRGNIRTIRVYSKKEGTKYAVQVRIKNSQKWVQARKDDFQLIYDTPEEANQVVIDYVESVKKTIVEKINDEGIKVKMNKERNKII